MIHVFSFYSSLFCEFRQARWFIPFQMLSYIFRNYFCFILQSDLCNQFWDDKKTKHYMLVNVSSFCHQNSINRHLHMSKHNYNHLWVSVFCKWHIDHLISFRRVFFLFLFFSNSLNAAKPWGVFSLESTSTHPLPILVNNSKLHLLRKSNSRRNL